MKRKKISIYRLIIFLLLFFIIGLSGFILGFLTSQTQSTQKIKKCKNNVSILEKKIDKLSKELKEKNSSKNVISFNLIPPQNSEIEDLLSVTKNEPKKEIKQENNISKINKSPQKPKLVIIIDDVAFKYEVNQIKKIPFKITPSFFPITKRHPFTPLYAKTFPDYMVHLPMQAMHYPHTEPDTLDVNNNYQTIKNRIDLIKKEFPRVKFINNHTGSKFTANSQAMNKLFKALKKDNLGFLDSRTTPFTKAKKVDKIYKIPMYSRDIFLDNKENSNYIQNQLKKAVKIAKKRGYAIAIGHPHKVTLTTLKNSANILKDVKVVYIDELNETKNKF